MTNELAHTYEVRTYDSQGLIENLFTFPGTAYDRAKEFAESRRAPYRIIKVSYEEVYRSPVISSVDPTAPQGQTPES